MRKNPIKKTQVLAIPLVLSFTCGHDAKRDNPLDLELTPPVQLEVRLNDITGIATLTWTPYRGSQTFAAYSVLRRSRQLVKVETLAIFEDAV